MSREIKFKAWLTLSDYDDDGNDKDFHAMSKEISVHHDGGIGLSVDEGKEIFGGDIFEQAIENGAAYENEGWCYWEGKYELMQYTGLKDKNGVEIYEGDIMLLKNSRGQNSNYQVIFWSGETASFDWRTLSDDWWPDGFTGFYNDYSVIGNIYENPDLLGGDKAAV